jgi:enterochelin esterase family protein
MMLAAVHDGMSPGEVDDFLRQPVPIVHGSTCTFVWRGDAEQVHLRHRIFALPTRIPLARVPGTDLWLQEMELPPLSRVEYEFEILQGGTTEMQLDRRNPLRSRDPFGEHSVVHGAGYVTPEWTVPDPEARPGSIQDAMIPSHHLGRPSRLRIYLPARFRTTRRYGLLIVHDGGDFLAYAGMKTALDNLIHRQ